MKQTDIINATKPFIYIAKSRAEITELQNRLPDFSLSISFIDPQGRHSGVYWEDPLVLKKCFVGFTQANLTLSGTIEVPDYFLQLTTNGKLWVRGCILRAHGYSLKAQGKVDFGPRCHRLEENIKPSDMLDEDWEKLIVYWTQAGYFEEQIV